MRASVCTAVASLPFSFQPLFASARFPNLHLKCSISQQFHLQDSFMIFEVCLFLFLPNCYAPYLLFSHVRTTTRFTCPPPHCSPNYLLLMWSVFETLHLIFLESTLVSVILPLSVVHIIQFRFYTCHADSLRTAVLYIFILAFLAIPGSPFQPPGRLSLW